MNCDPRLFTRAVNNLVQNSISHNPKGCHILLSLDQAADGIYLSVSDDGVGLSQEKLRELGENTHYMNSTDDRLNLRHGLGLVLVRQITEAHGGTMRMESRKRQGFKTVLYFPQYCGNLSAAAGKKLPICAQPPEMIRKSRYMLICAGASQISFDGR